MYNPIKIQISIILVSFYLRMTSNYWEELILSALFQQDFEENVMMGFLFSAI